VNYTLIWRSEALDELADMWVASTPKVRTRIHTAVEYINNILQITPYQFGESREGIARVGFADLLVVFYKVNEEALTSVVGHIRLNRRRI